MNKHSLDARSWDHPSHPLLSDSSLRTYLGQGASRRARVGRVRSLAFLSIPQSCVILSQTGIPLVPHN